MRRGRTDVIKNFNNCTQCAGAKVCEGGWGLSVCAIAAREALRGKRFWHGKRQSVIELLTGQAMPLSPGQTPVPTPAPNRGRHLCWRTVWAKAQLRRQNRLLPAAKSRAVLCCHTLHRLRALYRSRPRAAAGKSGTDRMIRKSASRLLSRTRRNVFLLRELRSCRNTTFADQSGSGRVGLLAELIAMSG